MKECVFDLDGVITDTAKYHFAAWKKLAADQLTLQLPAEFETELKGISRIDSLIRILNWGKIREHYNDQQIADLAAQKNDYYLKEIANLTASDILPGITTLINQLQEHDIQLSLASASKNAPFILKKLGLDDRFDAIADPAKVAHSKPAPDIFLEGAAEINLPPAECIGIEDAVAGIQAIKAAGMPAIGVGDPHELRQADEVVTSTAKLSFVLLESVWRRVNS
ncbi:beta-phosphoglucomutase [Liquorilactobacillus vini DSM 20605]|uniref:Beta-phosphoglucomutase n=1 Tax=Liquorilactobacillus vini DSM 20605 TaxID=1133569 RepID=A0A0R2CH52_9LACO|nr:beta-phosphoglucomutase [Liquorilactobacillus vini]KRM89332.1 beta-phosphoglucomutase [Liquorilactobacillus vini DSM 20605]